MGIGICCGRLNASPAPASAPKSGVNSSQTRSSPPEVSQTVSQPQKGVIEGCPSCREGAYTRRLAAMILHWSGNRVVSNSGARPTAGNEGAPATEGAIDRLTSQYEKQVQRLKVTKIGGKRSILIDAISSPSDEYRVGIHQLFVINAPVAQVEAALSRVVNYSKLFPDLVSTKIIEKTESTWLTEWVQAPAAFFLPQTTYRMKYWLSSGVGGRKLYRYQLEKGENLTESDGIIVLEPLAGATRYLEIDFFNANWGVARSLAGDQIWTRSIESAAESDYALALHIENPEWTFEKVREESKALVQGIQAREIFRKRLPFNELYSE